METQERDDLIRSALRYPITFVDCRYIYLAICCESIPVDVAYRSWVRLVDWIGDFTNSDFDKVVYLVCEMGKADRLSQADRLAIANFLSRSYHD